MAFTEKQKKRLEVVLGGDRKYDSVAKDIIAALDGVNLTSQSTFVAPMGTTTNLSAISASYADLPAARTSVNTLKTEVETRLDAIEAKMDEFLAAQVTSEQMAAS